MKNRSEQARREKVKGHVNARGTTNKGRSHRDWPTSIGAIGEPGRFRIMGTGMRRGVRSFDT